MAKFMNKREIVLVVLLILVFDLNGFCDMITSHLPYKDNFNWITYLLSIIFLLFDVFVFHYVITHEPQHDIKFAVDKNTETNIKVEKDKEKVEVKTKTKAEIEEEIKKKQDDDENMFELVEKIVINFIAAAVTCMIIFSIYFVANSKKQGLNGPKKVFVLLLPLILVVLSLLSFANVYLNLY